jgi:hypothetical protein
MTTGGELIPGVIASIQTFKNRLDLIPEKWPTLNFTFMVLRN